MMHKMETTATKDFDSMPTGVFEVPGEPAVIITGVPDAPPAPSDGYQAVSNTTKSSKTTNDTGFGEWLVGRKVGKMFDGQYYSGVVTEFDEDHGWYRTVYEDGDFEDLDWPELKDVLQPLDITVPLKALAMKVIDKNHKVSGRKVVKSSTPKSKSGRPRGRPRKHPSAASGKGGGSTPSLAILEAPQSVPSSNTEHVN